MTDNELCERIAMEIFADAAGLEDGKAAWDSASPASRRVCLGIASRFVPLIAEWTAEKMLAERDYRCLVCNGPVDDHPGFIERWRRRRRRCTTCGQRWSTPPCSRNPVTGQGGHTYGGGCGAA